MEREGKEGGLNKRLQVYAQFRKCFGRVSEEALSQHLHWQASTLHLPLSPAELQYLCLQ